MITISDDMIAQLAYYFEAEYQRPATHIHCHPLIARHLLAQSSSVQASPTMTLVAGLILDQDHRLPPAQITVDDGRQKLVRREVRYA